VSEPFQNERVLTPTGLGYDLWTRPALLDETVIDEVITRDSYRLRNLSMPGWVVIDCGAHVGVFSTLCAYRGAAAVYAVEPQPENLELLRLNVAPFGAVDVCEQALGSHGGLAQMAGESGGAHIEPGHPDAIEVGIGTLAALVDALGLDRVDLLKLDMEGGEVDALLACDHDTLAKVGRIVMETHGPQICPWVERPRVGEVLEHLLYTHNVEASGYPTRLGLLFAERNGVNGGW
jgi:FkbM family methyltransferase